MLRMTARDSWTAVDRVQQVALHQHNIRRFNGDVRARADGNAHVRPRQGRRVVDAVARPSRPSCPRPAERRTSRSLSCGRTSAMTRSIPSAAGSPRPCARCRPSASRPPGPSALKVSIAGALVGLTVSATAIKPSTLVWSAKYSGVLPSFASSAPCPSKSCRSTPCSRISCTLPA